MREKAVLFGPKRRLVGVWTAASPPAVSTPGTDESAPAVIMFNSGLVPHSGIWRLHVRLARALAAHGIPSLRFDFTGVGDSAAPAAGTPLDVIVREDIDAALAYVRESQQRERLVVFGLCSGAYDALDAADRHHAVTGVVAIDLLAEWKTWQHHAVHFGGRLLRAESWMNTLRGRNGRLQSLLGAIAGGTSTESDGAANIGPEEGVRPLLARDTLEERLLAFGDRGLRQLFLFTGGLEENYNHRGQFFEALPRLSGLPDLTVEYLPDADHTFSDSRQQHLLIERVAAWCRERGARATR